MNYDRELLFGILARQVGFLSRENLLAAISASLGQASPAPSDVPLPNASLDAAQRELLDQLVRRQLNVHGDARQALDHLEAAAALRAELQELVARLSGFTMAGGERTLPIDRAVAREETDSPPPVGEPPELRFRVLRPHARGGLGEVFVAHDTELNREVALKRIRDERLDTPQNRARFVLEAEVTGGLEHPGIVPVYSLGTSDDGRPFYAMRFIKGESLKEAIGRYHQANASGRDESQRLLDLRKLLRRFIDVCNAIEYAHSRGVLHRDLKPDNIMLGDFGETLVVDWGLAKPLGAAEPPVALGPAAPEEAALPNDGGNGGKPPWASGTAPTQMGSAIGTPAYMSPEQAAGDLDRVGVAADVYSLGATLYCLLAGRPPFVDEFLAQLLERVRRGDLLPPRAVRPEAPAALEAICLKAMSLEPADRYASPKMLAEELERWLADEPVAAHRAQWHERLARWARRHRRGVQAAVVALALVSVVSIGAAVLVHAAKQQAEHERDVTRLALEAETVAKREAHAALAAEREARLEASRALDNYVSMVTEEESFAGDQVQPLRKRLLADALNYYENLLDDSDGEGQVRHDLANAILRVGRIHHAGGSREEAIDAFGQALAAFSELAVKHPQVSQYQRDLALCQRSLAELKTQSGDLPGAVEHFRQALAIWQRLVESGSSSDRPDLAEAWYDLGRTQLGHQQADAASDSFRQSLAVLKQISAGDADTTALESKVAAGLKQAARREKVD
ncbi:MAG TPA: serine/threonine-protein kinase [Pirellulales bacterium]